MLEHNQIIKESWGFFRENLFEIIKFMLPIIIITSIISDLLVTFLPMEAHGKNDEINWWASYAYFLIKTNFYALDVALFLHFMKNYFDDTQLNAKQLLISFAPRFLSLLLLTSLAASFIFLGLILMIIPGLWLALRFSYAWMYFTFEKLNPFVSLYKSFKETGDDLVLIIKSFVVIVLPFTFVVIFYILIVGSLLNNFLTIFTLSILSSVVFLFLQVVLFRIYSQYGH